jgi:hypothetical protein
MTEPTQIRNFVKPEVKNSILAPPFANFNAFNLKNTAGLGARKTAGGGKGNRPVDINQKSGYGSTAYETSHSVLQ